MTKLLCFIKKNLNAQTPVSNIFENLETGKAVKLGIWVLFFELLYLYETGKKLGSYI